jgi:hypothetical protein
LSSKKQNFRKISADFSLLFLELRGGVLYEICGGLAISASAKFRNSLRHSLLSFLVSHANSATDRLHYNAAVAGEFRLGPGQRMDTILAKSLDPRIYRMYFTATSNRAICHSPIKIVQNGSELLGGPPSAASR